jgi:hypothetical protein
VESTSDETVHGRHDIGPGDRSSTNPLAETTSGTNNMRDPEVSLDSPDVGTSSSGNFSMADGNDTNRTETGETYSI